MREMEKERNGKAGKREGDYPVLELMLACSLGALFNIKLLFCFGKAHYTVLRTYSCLCA